MLSRTELGYQAIRFRGSLWRQRPFGNIKNGLIVKLGYFS